jgi:hypothetical protein
MPFNKNAAKSGGLNANRMRPCIYCKNPILDDEPRELTTDRSMGYGLIGLAHIPCIKDREEVSNEVV